MADPSVTFVVPAFGQIESLELTLQSIQSQQTKVQFETIVVLSGWTTDSAPRLPGVNSTFVNQGKWLPGKARNRGAREAGGDVLAFLDSDVVVPPNWLDQLLGERERLQTPMIGGFVQNANPEPVYSRVLHLIEFSEFLPGLPAGSRIAISTSNCLIERRLFLSMNGFLEDLAMSEDWEFCSRLARPPFFSARTGISHHHRSDWPRVRDHLRALGFWSGRLRRLRPEFPGSRLRHLPVAAATLPFWRLRKIQQRMRRARLSAHYRQWRDLPFVLRGLICWSGGFRKGLQSEENPSG